MGDGLHFYGMNDDLDALSSKPALNIRSTHGTTDPCVFLAIFEKDHAGNRANLKTRPQGLFFFRIDLGKKHATTQSSSSLLKLRGHTAAWTTPGGPKIYQYG